MKELVGDINKSQPDIISQIADIHSRLEKIHPFSDSNGGIGRSLMTAMLLIKNPPPAVIRQEQRQRYMTYLNKTQMKEDSGNLVYFICDVIVRREGG